MKKITAHEIVIRFVEDLPEEYISRVADVLGKESQFDSGRILHRLQSVIPQEAVRDNMRLFVENWEKIKDATSPGEMRLPR